MVEFGSIKIDLNKLFIYRGSQNLKINSTEKIILEKMINSPGKIFKREEIGKEMRKRETENTGEGEETGGWCCVKCKTGNKEEEEYCKGCGKKSER